jgi:ElaB/YqjD/DUF883 family membrane-anchored ribosome-binding protein
MNMRGQRTISRYGALAAALVLCVTAHRASANELAEVGKGFASSLAGEAAGCRDKITGINLESVKGVFGCLIEAVKKTAKEALVNLMKALYDKGLELLKANAPAGKAKLQELAGKITAILPAAKSVIDPVLGGLDTGGEAFVEEAAKCKDHIKALDLESVKATFTCLGQAAKTGAKAGAVAIVQGLFDEFVRLLRSGCGMATQKLAALAEKVAAVVPQAKSLVGPAIEAVQNGCNGAVDKVSNVPLPK